MAISNQLSNALESALGSPETRDELVVILNNEISGTSANTPGSLVRRDGAGGFSAGTITASLTGAASLNVLKTGDTMTGTLNMSNHSIINVSTPSSPQDATNKSYVDTLNAAQDVNISANSSAITALQVVDTTQNANIATNTTNIATNTANIATNTTNIATNTTNIATNTANIATLQGVGLSSNMHTLLATSTTIQAAATAAGLNTTTYLAQTLATAPASDIRIFIRAAIAAGFFEIKQQMINAYDAVHSRRDPKFAKNIERIIVTQTHINQQFIDLQLSPMSGSARLTLNGTSLVEGAWLGGINSGPGITTGSDYQMNYGGKYPTIYNIVNEVSAKEKSTVTIPVLTASPLGNAAGYGLIASSTITNTGNTVVTGNLALFPGTSVVGFPPGTVSGTQNINNAAANSAITDATSYFNTNSAIAISSGTAISATLDGQTLTPGTYKTGAATLAQSGAGTLTFNGAGTYIIYTSSTLTTGAGGVPTMTLSGGATAANIYWLIGSSATINSGTAGTFQGNVLAQASITDTIGGTVNGVLAALTGAVTLSAAAIINSTSVSSFYDTAGGPAKYFTIDSGTPDAPHYFWFKVTDAALPGTDPAPGGTGFEVDILMADSTNTVASKLNTVVAAQSTLFTSSVSTNTVTITNVNIGAVSIITTATSGTTVARTVLGITSNLNNKYMALVGTYGSFVTSNGTSDCLLWFNVDGLGDVDIVYQNSQLAYELLMFGILPIQVNISSGSTAFTIAIAIANAIRQNIPTLFSITEPTATLATTQSIGSTTITSTTITVLSPEGTAGGIAPGMSITGTGIPANTLVVSISGNSVVLNNAATSTNSGSYFTFSYLPIKIYKDEYILNAVDTHIVPVSTLVNTAGRGFNLSTCFQVIGTNSFDATTVEPSGRIGFLGGNIPASLTLPPKTLSTINSPGTTTSGSTRISNFNMPARIVYDTTIRNGQFVSGSGITAGTTVGQINVANFGSTGVFSIKKTVNTKDLSVMDPNGYPTTMTAYQTYAAANPTVLNSTLASVTTTGDLTYNSPVITNITTTGIVAGMQVQGPYIPFGSTVPANTTLSATLTTGSTIAIMNSIVGIIVGMIVTGTGIPAATSVLAISPGSITLNNQATITGVSSLTFTAIGTTTLVLSMPAGLLNQTGALNTAASQTLIFGSCTSVATQSQTCSMTTGSPYASIATTTPNLCHLMVVTAGTGFPVNATIMNVATTYSFTVSPANATAGAVYSNNNFSYVVGTTISAGTTLSGSGNGTPTASGTLTKVSGTGDATITFSTKSASSTLLTMSNNATVTASNSITFAPSAGMLVSGTGIPTGTFVTARAGTTLSLSAIPTVVGVQALSFQPYYPNLTLGVNTLSPTTPGLSADQRIFGGVTPTVIRVRTVSGGDVITQNVEVSPDSLFYPFSAKANSSNDIILSQPTTSTSTSSLSFTVLNPTSIEPIESLTPIKVGDVLIATYDVDDQSIPTYVVQPNIPYAGPSWDGSDSTIDTWYNQYAYTFIVPSSSITSGAIYSHNGFQYTARYTTSSSTSFYTDGTGSPLSSGTLTKVSGSGPATLVFSSSLQSTITMPYKVKGEGIPILCLGFTDGNGDLDGVPSMAGQMPTGKCYFVSYPGSTKPFGAAVGGFTDTQTADIQAWNNNSQGNPFSDFRMSSCVRAIGALVESFNCGPMFILGNDKIPQVARMLCQARPDLFRGMYTTEPFDQSLQKSIVYNNIGTSFTSWSSVGIPLAGTTSNGSTSVNMGSGALNYTLGLWNGMPVSGNGIQAGTTVSSFTTTTVTLSLPANASGSSYLLFGGASGTALRSDYFYEYCSSNDEVSSNPSLVTGNVTSGSNVITGLTSTKGILKGMSLTGTGINTSDTPISCSLTSGSVTISSISPTDIAKIHVGMQVYGGGIFNGTNGGTNALTLQAQGQTIVLSVGVSSVVVSNAATVTNTAALLWFINVVRAVTPTTITMTNNAFASGSGVSIRGRMIARDSNFYKLLTLNFEKHRAMTFGIAAGNIKYGRNDNLLTAQAYSGGGFQAWNASINGTAGQISAPTAYIQSATYRFGTPVVTQGDDGTHPNMWIDTSIIPFDVRVSNLSEGNAFPGQVSGTNAPLSFDNGASVGVDQGSGIYRSASLTQPFKFWGGSSLAAKTFFVSRSYLSSGEMANRFIYKKIQVGPGEDLPNPTSIQMGRCTGMTFYRDESTNTYVYMLNTSILVPTSIVIGESTEWALGPQASFRAMNPFNDVGTSPLAVGFGTYLLNQFINSTDSSVPGAGQNWQKFRNIIKPQL